MTKTSLPPLARRCVLATSLALFGTAALGQTPPATGCAPTADAQVPIVDTGLPVVQIWTTNLAPILDRENYLTACMRITDGSVKPYGAGLFHGTIKIRGRGNTSWNMPKQGWRLKLDSAAPVLDMPAHKDWVLIANYADKTLLRNNVALELSRRVGMAWTPRMRHADVYLNNQFVGNYLLGEKIEVAPTRVPITAMSTSDITFPATSGGYLLQFEYADRLSATDTSFRLATSGLNVLMESPSGSSVQPAQKAYISAYMQELENAIVALDANLQAGWQSRIEIDSLVNYFIVQEFMKNKDASLGSSVYLYKPNGGRLRMGPLWDFDIAAGNIDFFPEAMTPQGWYLEDQSLWFGSLRQDPVFNARLKSRWREVRASLRDIDSYIDQQARMLDASQRQNFAVWPILGTYVWPNQVVTGSYRGEVTWLRKRFEWMDRRINND